MAKKDVFKKRNEYKDSKNSKIFSNSSLHLKVYLTQFFIVFALFLIHIF